MLSSIVTSHEVSILTVDFPNWSSTFWGFKKATSFKHCTYVDAVKKCASLELILTSFYGLAGQYIKITSTKIAFPLRHNQGEIIHVSRFKKPRDYNLHGHNNWNTDISARKKVNSEINHATEGTMPRLAMCQ